MTDAKDLVGVWKLVSLDSSSAKGRRRYPFGRYPGGYLIFTPEGWMSATAMPEHRGQPSLPLEERGTPMQVRTWLSWRGLRRLVRYVLAATHYISYSGRYTVKGDKVFVHVEVSQMPGLVGTIQERTFRLENNRLVLTAETAWAHLRFIWERASATYADTALHRVV